MEHISEADAMQDNSDEGDFGDNYVEALEDKKNDMIARYKYAEKALRGNVIECPACGKKIVKRSHQHKFCVDSKCKDRYWNFVDENRHFRMMMINKG